MTQKEKQITEARVSNLLGLCEYLKGIKYNSEASVRDFYFYCLKNRKVGYYYPLDCFKKWFPREFSRMQSILNKRTLIKRDIEFMQSLRKGRVYFGALTFDNELDAKTEANKRKMAQRYLDKFMPIYELIEEYGDENGRYHIHFLGIMEANKTYLEFHSGWKSYSYIEGLRSVKKASKYLCDYVVKSVPRIRRNGRLTQLLKEHSAIEELKLLSDSDMSVPF